MYMNLKAVLNWPKKAQTGITTGSQVLRGKHVHFVTGHTTVNDGHQHQFNFATLIQAPLV